MGPAVALALGLWCAPAAARSPAQALSDAVSDLAARGVPAVVLVEVDRARPLSPELQELLQGLGIPRSWKSAGAGEATGSGVIVSPEGRVITNAHVVEGAVGVTVLLSDQRRLAARVEAVDPRTDVAVLAIDGPGPFPWLPFGESSGVRVGDIVLAIGNPFEFQSTVTLGIVSATGRRGLDEGEIQDYLQTDASVNPGSSGGPLIDLDGRVIGINTAIYAPNVDQDSGISFAIPSDLVRRVVADLDAAGRVPRSWVGLVTASVSEVDGDPTLRGAEILRVVPGSPAERAGLRRGDIVVSVDGEPTTGERALRTLVLVREVGSTLAFVVMRDGQRVPIEVTTGEERDLGVSADALQRDAMYWGGLYVATPSDDLRARYGVGQERGLVVVRVDPGSPAAQLGLAPGDVVLEVAGRPVGSIDELRAVLGGLTRGVIVLGVQRGGHHAWAVLPAP